MAKKKRAYYLFADAEIRLSFRHANLEESFSRCVPRRSVRFFFSSPSHTRKAPVYYLNNGSRARFIVSPLFLSQRVTLLVTGLSKGRGLLCFESSKKTKREDEREGRKGGQVPCRIAVMAKTELRRLKTRGVPPPWF